MKISLFALVFSLACCLTFAATVETDLDVYLLEYSIDSSDEFKELASINQRTLKQSQQAAQASSYGDNSEDDAFGEQHQKQAPTSHFTQIQTNPLDSAARAKLLKATSQSLIHLRLCNRKASGACQASGFTYVSNLLASGLNLNLTLNTGINSRLLSMTIRTQHSNREVSKSDAQRVLDETETIGVFACVQSIKVAQAPDTEVYLEKLKKEIEQKEKGAQADNQSFLSKYWMYIVPFVIIMFISQLANPEAAGGGR